jgi:hypothetical protein
VMLAEVVGLAVETSNERDDEAIKENWSLRWWWIVIGRGC